MSSPAAGEMPVGTKFLALENNQTKAHHGQDLHSTSATRHTAPATSPATSASTSGWLPSLLGLLALLFSLVSSAVHVCVLAFPGVLSLAWSLVSCLVLFLAETLVACVAHHWERLIGEPFRRVILEDFDPVLFEEFLDDVAIYFGERALLCFLCLVVSVPMGCIYAWRGIIFVWENLWGVFSLHAVTGLLGFVWRVIRFCVCWVFRPWWNFLRRRGWVPDWEWSGIEIWHGIVNSFRAAWAGLAGLARFFRHRGDRSSRRSNHHHDSSRGRDRTTSRACYGRTLRYDRHYDSRSTTHAVEGDEEYGKVSSYRPGGPATAGARNPRRREREVADQYDCYERYENLNDYEQGDSYRPSSWRARSRGRREEEEEEEESDYGHSYGGGDSYRASHDK